MEAIKRILGDPKKEVRGMIRRTCPYCCGIGSIVKRPKKKYFYCTACGRREWI